jgi:hypothetical protein
MDGYKYPQISFRPKRKQKLHKIGTVHCTSRIKEEEADEERQKETLVDAHQQVSRVLGKHPSW